MNHYIEIMIESLQKKCGILDEIIDLSHKQRELAGGDTFDEQEFERLMEEKSIRIGKLDILDDGFESVYERVREELLENKDAYAEQIRSLQELVSMITQKSMEIQAEEERNYKAIASRFSLERNKIRQTKASTKMARDYYSSMNRVNQVDPQFMDHKN